MEHEKQPPTVGTIISGRYELLRPLGYGGLAHVFLARDHEDHSEVAVKCLRAPDDRARAMLLREARILSQLVKQTTGTVTYRDFVQEHGDVYLVTELVRGMHLHDWQEGRPRREILRLYARIAGVLHEIHEAGVVHRDVKPTNVMVVDGNGSPDVRLMDFGFSRDIAEPDILTGENTILGTPVYMPPEMLTGQTATGASDVYSLGVMLLEALTGRRPFGSSIMEILSTVLKSPPDLSDLDNSELGTLIGSMLAKEPEARPSAQAVAHTLAALADATDAEHTQARSVDVLTGNTSALPNDHRRPLTASTLKMRPADTRKGAPHRDIPIAELPALSRALTFWPVALALTLACIIFAVVWQLSTRGFITASAWILLLVASALLLAFGLARMRSEVRSRSGSQLPAHVELRLRAIDERLRTMSQMSHSLVLELNQLRPQVDESRLKQLMRESVLIALSELQVGASSSDVGKAIKALADVARPDDGPPPWHKRLSTWLTVGGLAVGFAGGTLGVMSSSGLWKPNAPPVIHSITFDVKRASRVTPMELRVDASDSNGDRLEYAYTASEGSIQGDGALALWHPSPAPRTDFVRVEVAVSDGRARAVRSQTVRINNRPALTIVGPNLASPTATVSLSVEGEPDPDGDPLSYRWSVSPGDIRDPAQQHIVLVMPSTPGSVRVRCMISDGAESWYLDHIIEVRD